MNGASVLTASATAWKTLPAPEAPAVCPPVPLTRQYPRILPLKWVIRIVAALANETEPGWPPDWKLSAELTQVGADIYRIAVTRSAGKDALSLATGFPIPDDDELQAFAQEKSVQRFMRFFVGRVAQESAVEGLGQELGLLVVRRGWNRTATVALTDAGIRFARLPNPFLDGESPEPLSHQESRMLVEHVRQFRPVEYDHMRRALQALAEAGEEGLRGAQLWSQVMSEYYETFRSGRGRTGPRLGKTNVTSQSALLGRLSDLGTVESSGKARATTYRIARDRCVELGLV